jgi:hypothetical protein
MESRGRSFKQIEKRNIQGTFDLDKDATYEFKYVIDGEYANEPEADSFKWNDFAGTENSVITL